MSKHDFTAAEFAERRAKARRAVSEAGLDWFVLFHPVTIRWLTGSDAKSYQEFQCLLISAEEGPVAVLTREGERNEFLDDALVDRLETYGGGENEDPIPRFAALVAAMGADRGRIGIEVPAYYLHPHHYVGVRRVLGGERVVEANTLIHDLTLEKSPAEIAYIREASRMADEAMAVLVENLRVGASELELSGEVYRALLARGSFLAASPINLVSGERTAYSHGAPTERRLARGEAVNVEFGATFRRYTATIGRQFSLGPPATRMQEIYDTVRRASDAMIAAIRDGVPATVPHEAACRIIAEAGMASGRVHTSGYGLAPGFPPTWGEPIHMIGGSPYVLKAGMVVTVEPPVFLGNERLGARIIDNVLVTGTGCELLSRSDRSLVRVG